MTEASRYLSEYGELSRLPLFSQPTNGSTPAAAKLGAPVTAPPAAGPDVDWSVVSESARSGVRAAESGRRL